MIDLYAAGTSNGVRARIALEECGLPYQLHVIDLAKGENKTPQFLALNPNGQIPVIVDGAITLSQSTAILVYAGEKSGKYIPKEGAKRAAFWQALMSASTDITPMMGTVFLIIRSQAPHTPTADMFKARFRNYLKVWDERLGRQKYAAGDEVTLADFSLYAGYWRAKATIADTTEGLANLERWGAEIGARPATQRALKF